MLHEHPGHCVSDARQKCATAALAGHPRYQKIRDLNSGGFGFVQLCRDAATGGQVSLGIGTLMQCW